MADAVVVVADPCADCDSSDGLASTSSAASPAVNFFGCSSSALGLAAASCAFSPADSVVAVGAAGSAAFFGGAGADRMAEKLTFVAEEAVGVAVLEDDVELSAWLPFTADEDPATCDDDCELDAPLGEPDRAGKSATFGTR